MERACRSGARAAVERWFRELTDKAIRAGAFHSAPDLIAAIEKYMQFHNDEPKPLVWFRIHRSRYADNVIPQAA